MAPVAYGALASIAGVVVISVFVGAFIGAVTGRLKRGLAWGALLVTAYLLIAPTLYDVPFSPFMMLNAPATIMTFLSTYLATHQLRIRSAWLAALAGFGCGLVVVVLYLLLFRWLFMANAWTLPKIALVADVVLLLLIIRFRKRLPA